MPPNSNALTLHCGQTRLELEAREINGNDRPNAGDFRISARVTTESFGGRNDRVWVSAQSWRDFLAGLRALELHRSGEARIVSMSPSDLDIRIGVYDHAGHVRATGHVGTDLIWVDGVATTRISFRIELDPSTLVQTVTAFGDLAATNA